MLAAIRARVEPAHADLRGRRVARRQRAAQLARAAPAPRRRATLSRGRGGVGAARPDGRRHRDRPGPQPHLHVATSCSTLKPKSLAMARRFPGLLDAARDRARAHDVRVRRRRHRAAARLRRTPTTTGRARRRKPWLRERRACRRSCSTRATIRSCPARRCPVRGEVERATSLLEQPDDGGHVGLPARALSRRHLDWLPRRLLDFFAARAREPPAAQPCHTCAVLDFVRCHR